VASKLALDYENQSAWNYLLGLFHLPGAQPHALGRVAQVHMLCAAALEARPSCSPALDVLAQYYASQAAASVAAGAERDAAAAASAALHALNAAGVADPMREAYWAERRRALQLLLPADAAAAAAADVSV
jgi:chemotaxis response regulator CheB